MPTIRITDFKGIIPRSSSKLLPEGNAQTAQNVDVLGGNLQAVKAPGTVATLPDALRLSVYPYNGGYLSWPTDVDVERGPVADDQFDRIYYTGDGAPKVRGILDGVEVEYDLGLPVPEKTPKVIAQEKTAVEFTRTWRYFYEETDGSKVDEFPLTNVITDEEGKVFSLTGLPDRILATSSAIFIMWFEDFDANGNSLGRVFPGVSAYSFQTDRNIAGASVSALQVTTDTSATFTLDYDTSNASDFVVDRAYVYTFVSVFGEEGPPSTASSIVPVDPTQDAKISGMSSPPTGDYNITRKRIYRTVTGNVGTNFQFVAEVSANATSYVDKIADADTGEALPSTSWTAPPNTLAGLVAHPDGFLAGFVDRTLYFSDVHQPHAWPTAFALTVPFDIVGLSISGNAVEVMTKAYPYYVAGITPDGMSRTRIDIEQACASKRSIVSNGTFTIYASPDGLVVLKGAAGQLVTDGYYQRDEWQATNPTTMVAGLHDRRYHGFTSTSAVIFDFDAGPSALTTSDEIVGGVHTDLETDRLLMIQGTALNAWRTGTTNKTMEWTSKEYYISHPWRPTCARVIAETYPVTILLYADGSQVLSQSVPDNEVFRLPILRKEKYWACSVQGTSDVHELVVGTVMAEVAGVAQRAVA